MTDTDGSAEKYNLVGNGLPSAAAETAVQIQQSDQTPERAFRAALPGSAALYSESAGDKAGDSSPLDLPGSPTSNATPLTLSMATIARTKKVSRRWFAKSRSPVPDVDGPSSLKTLAEEAKNPIPVDQGLIDLGFEKFSDVPAPQLTVLDEISDLSDSFCNQRLYDTGGDIPSTSDFDDTRRQLEELQIRTVFSLVDHVQVESSNKHILFLSNKQARKFDFDDMSKILSALLIPEPKLVVNLLPTNAFARPTLLETERLSLSRKESTMLRHQCHSEIGGKEALETDRQMQIFLEELLPVLIQTKAVVVVHDDSCSFARAFSDICMQYAKTVGGKMPFTVIMFASAATLYESARTAGTNASILSQASKRWKTTQQALDEMLQFRPARSFGGCPSGCTHFVVADGLSSGNKLDGAPISSFQDSFVRGLTEQQIPTIAIGTQHISSGFVSLAEHLASDLPLLLINSRRVPQTTAIAGWTLDNAESLLVILENQLVSSGKLDCYDASIVSFLHTCILNSRESALQLASSTKKKSERKENSALYRVIESLQKELDDKPKADSTDSELRRATTIYHKLQVYRRKVRAHWITKLLSKARDDLGRIDGVAELDKWLENRCIDWKHHFGFAPAGTTGKLSKYFDMLLDTYGANSGGGFLCLKRAILYNRFYMYTLCMQEGTDKTTRQQAQIELGQTLDTWILELAPELETEWLEGDMPEELHVALDKLLTSPKLHSGNLHEPKHLLQIVKQVAKIDRLPHTNSIEANFLIRQAWDDVDVYTKKASRSKFLTKLFYMLSLLFAAAMIIIVNISINKPDVLGADTLGVVVIALSLTTAVVAAFTTFVDPAQQWGLLRGAAIAIEVEVWKFRTRTGVYATAATNRANSKAAEKNLRDFVSLVEQHVAKSASASGFGSSFNSMFELFGQPKKGRLKLYTHGQYKGCRDRGTYGSANGRKVALPDDHHSPLHPEEYFKLRVEPTIRYYQNRISRHFRMRAGSEFILLVGALAGTLLAFYDAQQWAPMAAVVTLCVSSWGAFRGTAKKLSHDSNTIDRTKSIMLWWNSLTRVEKLETHNINHAINSCEVVFESVHDQKMWLPAHRRASANPAEGVPSEAALESIISSYPSDS